MTATTGQDPEQQYLTFLMAGEEYGVDILAVQEIRGWEATTRIPNAPEWIQGVINLRGTIVPIMDLRIRFGLPRVVHAGYGRDYSERQYRSVGACAGHYC